MSGADRSRVEHIRALLDEADRVRRDSERMSTEVDRLLKQPFWPERRRTPRISSEDERRKDSGDAA